MPTVDVAWALSWFRDADRAYGYQEARDYYDGRHKRMFATDRFDTEFGKLLGHLKDNLCPAVIDSLTDRLEMLGFEAMPESDDLADRAWQVWQRNRMDMHANQVHRESLLTGDGYVIVWPDPMQRAAIWPQQAHELIVDYSDSDAGVIERAAKMWQDDNRHLRLTVYLPDRAERWRSENPLSPNADWQRITPESFVAWAGGSPNGRAVVPNPYGVVPVFHFPNKRHRQSGISELADVIPLQDVLNKSVTDMVVAAEFAAYRQRWATGIQPQFDENGMPAPPSFRPGQDTMFSSSDPDSRFGTFDATPLQQYLDVQDSYRAEIARVSGVPLHYLFISKGDFPSGEAMKSAEARFTRKIRDRQESFGTVWEQVVGLCLQIDGAGPPAATRLQVRWESASPRSEREALEVLLLKKALGVSNAQLLAEVGYERDQIEQMLAEQRELAVSSNGDVGAAMVMPTATGRMRIPDVVAQSRDGTV